MNAEQENKFTMMRAVSLFLSNHQATWAGNSPMENLVVAFDAGCTQIKEQAGRQAQRSAGSTLRKAELRQAAATIGLTMAMSLHVYATQFENVELATDSYTTSSGLGSLRDTELVTKLQNIHSLISEHLSALAAYGVVTQTITDFQTAIDAFQGQLAAPRIRITERYAAGLRVDALLVENMRRLDMIQALLLPYQAIEPSLMPTFMKARRIVNAGHRRTSLVLWVEASDGIDGNPPVAIPDGTPMTLSKADVSYPIQLESGQATLPSLRAGTYTLEAAGYERQAIRILSGRSNHQNLVMQNEIHISF